MSGFALLKRISEETLRDMRRMRDEGFNWEQIGRKTGINSKTIRRRLDPEFRNKEIQRERSSRQTSGIGKCENPPMTRKELVAYRLALPPDDRDAGAKLLGDPPRWRSALNGED